VVKERKLKLKAIKFERDHLEKRIIRRMKTMSLKLVPLEPVIASEAQAINLQPFLLTEEVGSMN